jgi:4,5-dihydroxyphthalate decarboxylase
MPDFSLSVAVWRYDRTQAIYDGRIKPKGANIKLIDAPLEEIFSRALGKAEFDVSELSFSNFLRLTAAGQCSYLGIPIFPSRSFRHGTFYVRKDAGITEPRDLVGKRIGVREYSMTAALAARGGLRDQFGLKAEDMHWVMGDVDENERDVIELPKLYRPIRIETAPAGKLLSRMLLDGEVDALLAYKPIVPYKQSDPRVKRLFEDPAEVEERYFKETGIFPIMHLIGVRRDVAAARPDLAMSVYQAFAAAQAIADEDLHLEQALKIGLPWLGREVKRTIRVMGEDYWASGFKANRHVLERMIGWSYEDGLISSSIKPEALFHPSVLDT